MSLAPKGELTFYLDRRCCRKFLNHSTSLIMHVIHKIWIFSGSATLRKILWSTYR